MSNNCSIKLTVDKLPKIISKVEYFLFRAMEQKGMDFYKISTQPRTTESIEVINKIKSKEYTKEQLDSLVGKKFASVLIKAAALENTNSIGTNVYRIAQMVHLFDTVKNSLIPEYIADYIEDSKISEKEGDLAQAGDYAMFATNLQNLVSQWNQIAPNFLTYSEIFSVKTKFTVY
jgi:endonuclease III